MDKAEEAAVNGGEIPKEEKKWRCTMATQIEMHA